MKRHPLRSTLWADITQYRGHYVYKDFSKVVAAAVGLGLVVFSAYADFKAGRPIDNWGAVALLSYAFGLSLVKLKELQDNRRTTDDNGNPLVQPGTSEPPATPVPMPTTPPTP